MIKNPCVSGFGLTIFFPAMGAAFLCLTIASPVWGAKSKASLKAQGRYTGTQSCRSCHEKFYKLWSPSHHGKAMQAYDDHFAAEYLRAPKADITVASNKYRAFIGTGQGWVEERGPAKTTKLPIKYALGGKNVFYFLTPIERGKMQTLPVAYFWPWQDSRHIEYHNRRQPFLSLQLPI